MDKFKYNNHLCNNFKNMPVSRLKTGTSQMISVVIINVHVRPGKSVVGLFVCLFV